METVYTTKTREIILPSLTTKIRLWLFGDIHRDAPSCDVDRWKWFISEAKRTQDEFTYYMGLGDYNDFASSREQEHLQTKRGLHRETIIKLDGLAEKDNRRIAREMSFMRGKLLGFIEGNHTWIFMNGKTATEDLSERMGTEFLGWLNHFTLKVKFENGGNRQQNVYIVSCHGQAGGKTVGNSVNQLDNLRQVFPVADIYCMGHDHQRLARPISVLLPSSRQDGTGEVRLKQKRQFLCRSGSFKKAYMEGVSGYEVGRLLKPADLGALMLEIGFHRDQKEGDDRVITDITAIV